ncbi:MAG: hypothetical protein A3K19_16585 [Lentisphaerae bacterium RIFOXYB12_FULL_65_16]|nr:MAG: hypothetical protein A3K18_24695 [Lentisphaerae bacterium RIFOXYA12_64_32]OGV89060.1 MAG: hypothetical protein A3K19_16585 [Lentisphaerae bacterium RIFOXYB12_FULL_65_16]
MSLSITTDYAADKGCPEPYLHRIADAGFSHVHWCHQWNTDFLYSRWEVSQIRKWLREYGLALLDLHGSLGPEKNWASSREYERRAGIDLVRNRLQMTAQLGGDVVIMHVPAEPDWTALKKSLDALEPVARKCGVRIAVENGRFDTIDRILAEYGPEYVGLCYDCGHGNVGQDGLSSLDAIKDRLISVHLHDNDGTGDQHKLLFSGTVDWPRLARIIAASSYRKCVSMETSMRNSGIPDEEAFLAKAFETGTALTGMIEPERRKMCG